MSGVGVPDVVDQVSVDDLDDGFDVEGVDDVGPGEDRYWNETNETLSYLFQNSFKMIKMIRMFLIIFKNELQLNKEQISN